MRNTPIRFLIVLMCFVLSVVAVAAQEATIEPSVPTATPMPAPARWTMNYGNYQAQTWNNCGPATLTNALSYFGYTENQSVAAAWLKPNYEDKNVSPWQMEEFVDSQLPNMAVYAEVRYGGTLDTIKRLISNDFPVIIEAGYNPEPERLGWMGHYLLVKGYDDTTQQITTSDSYLGDNTTYSYDHIETFWQHFNYVYITLYESAREAELLTLLGSDADKQTNLLNALNIAKAEVTANGSDAFAWFNMGTSFEMLSMYAEAVTVYDEARKYGLPFRMLWYQFGPLEAYYQVGRYDDMVTLVQQNLNDGGGQYVEESFYYGGLARLGKGDRERALSNFDAAIAFNPNFTPAREAKVQAGG